MVCGWHIPVSATVVLQIYVILTEALRGVHPVQYALLSDKNRSIYDRLFDMVKETVPEANSRSISCDFQMAAFSERTAFPGVRLHGCFFHLAPNMRRPPVFLIEMWSMYRRVVDGDNHINNFSEAAHRRLKAELGMAHLAIWKLIYSLRKVQHATDLFYEQLVANHQPLKQLKKYRESDKRIVQIARQYNDRDSITYLQGLAHNYD
ncbi:hypothetical protein T4A_9173 [Trichinella pseudospiralis]|uniref:MULE transposase domain-containing protein n=1 Tax=Trichinella pseudospiralis TaxID=6337 RepID=A0A0V1ESM1_TRIPS|nr:hypothetical protein T4A_9173 [Trichinella pseudospiralis]